MVSNKSNNAFIDSQNLNLGVRSLGWQLDFKKFRIFLTDTYNVSQAYLFIGYIPSNEKLYAILQKYGYILIFKPVLEFKKGSKRRVKGNVDAELVLHAMIEVENYDKAVIVSGDGDFYCLIEYLESKGKLLKIIAPNNKFSSLLRKFGRYVVTIPKVCKKVERENKFNLET